MGFYWEKCEKKGKLMDMKSYDELFLIIWILVFKISPKTASNLLKSQNPNLKKCQKQKNNITNKNVDKNDKP